VNYRIDPKHVFIAMAVAAVATTIVILFASGRSDLATGWAYWTIMMAFVLGPGIWWSWDAYAGDGHMRRMAKFAMTNSWQFAPETGEYRRVFGSFPFARGVHERDVAWIAGTYNGRSCASFTHEYEEGSDDEQKRIRRWQITLVELEYPLSTVDILPDDVLAKFEKFFGGMDIDFESADFNEKWRVKAQNLKYAHDIVHPRMMERLLKSDADGLAIRVENAAVLCWQAGRQGPEDLARRLNVLTAVAKLIPEFVLREFEYEWKKLEAARRKREEGAPDWAKTPYALSSGHYTELGKQQYAADAGEDQPDKPRRGGEKRAW
jgi:hypothetical protein